MPRKDFKIKNITEKHWNIIKDYCNGENLRDIEDKYRVGGSTAPNLAKQVGITPRPSGFASYKVARAWVLQARNEYAIAVGKKENKCLLNPVPQNQSQSNQAC